MMEGHPAAMREPVIDLEAAAAKRDAAKPAAVPALRADPDLNLMAESEEDARSRPPAPAFAPGLTIVPREPTLELKVATAPPATASPARPWQPPVLGSLSVIFGIAALFKATLLLAPLALVFALLAALGRQFSWAAIGGIAGLAALATSPWFWGLLGLAWVVDYLGLDSWLTSLL
jgi:hypothetical protein